jgi:hypothetical protein
MGRIRRAWPFRAGPGVESPSTRGRTAAGASGGLARARILTGTFASTLAGRLGLGQDLGQDVEAERDGAPAAVVLADDGGLRARATRAVQVLGQGLGRFARPLPRQAQARDAARLGEGERGGLGQGPGRQQAGDALEPAGGGEAERRVEAGVAAVVGTGHHQPGPGVDGLDQLVLEGLGELGAGGGEQVEAVAPAALCPHEGLRILGQGGAKAPGGEQGGEPLALRGGAGGGLARVAGAAGVVLAVMVVVAIAVPAVVSLSVAVRVPRLVVASVAAVMLPAVLAPAVVSGPVVIAVPVGVALPIPVAVMVPVAVAVMVPVPIAVTVPIVVAAPAVFGGIEQDQQAGAAAQTQGALQRRGRRLAHAEDALGQGAPGAIELHLEDAGVVPGAEGGGLQGVGPDRGGAGGQIQGLLAGLDGSLGGAGQVDQQTAHRQGRQGPGAPMGQGSRAQLGLAALQGGGA